jgi:O-methyltransferase
MRKIVNRMLRNSTGYELRRVAPGKPAAAKAQPPAAAKPAPKPAPKPVKPAAKPELQLPHDFDDESKAIIRAVKPRTMTSPEKLNALVASVRYVVRHGIEGDIVECGVWRGGSMMAAAKALQSVGDTGRHLHLYDTFEGMSEPTEHDKRHDGRSAADMLAATEKDSAVWAYATLEDVQQAMGETAFPAERIHYYKGKVEDTIPENVPEKISILRLDTDWYESTRHELDHLYPRLSPGGVLLLDDYGWWDGARRAVDEWLEETGHPLLLMRMDVGRLAIKPLDGSR